MYIHYSFFNIFLRKISVVLLLDYSADPDDPADAEDSEDPVDFFIHQGRSISLSFLQAAQQTCILEETFNFDLTF